MESLFDDGTSSQEKRDDDGDADANELEMVLRPVKKSWDGI